MPALFALGQHAALEEVSGHLLPNERLFSFLDDIYVLCRPDRATAVYKLVETALLKHTGISCNLGKTRVWNRAGVVPAGVDSLGEDAWVGGLDRLPAERGLKVLGAPLGTPDFVRTHGQKRLAEERRLLDLLPQLPDLHCAWVLLLMCASPRFNYRTRTISPFLSEEYQVRHDEAK